MSQWIRILKYQLKQYMRINSNKLWKAEIWLLNQIKITEIRIRI